MEHVSERAPQTFIEVPVPESIAPGGGVAQYDVVIVGGGPAGLSAALVLGRCRRTVLVCDSGHPRNKPAKNMHGFLSRDGMSPSDLLRISREQLGEYPTVSLREVEVKDARRVRDLDVPDGGFVLDLSDGSRVAARRVLLATGVKDNLPDLEGFEGLYGTSVHHCPICDGWEWRDKRVAVYGKDAKGFGLAQEMTAWTRDIVLVSDGPSELDSGQLEFLDKMRIRVDERRVARLDGECGYLRRIVFQDGEALERDAMFFSMGWRLHGELARKLGCNCDDKGCVWTEVGGEETSVQGVYCAGDASRNAQLVIVAAAEGAVAAVAINKSLTADYKEVQKVELSAK